jgi:hypothetical protein
MIGQALGPIGSLRKPWENLISLRSREAMRHYLPSLKQWHTGLSV